jgi:thiol-disulfide isomerase/thioredoxin
LSEIPALLEIAKEKGDKLEIIAMEVQRLPEEQLKIFKESKKLNYTVLSGERTGNSEFISYIAERAQWTGSIPFLVGITPKGEVGVVHVGGMGKNAFEKVFDQLSQ